MGRTLEEQKQPLPYAEGQKKTLTNRNEGNRVIEGGRKMS